MSDGPAPAEVKDLKSILVVDDDEVSRNLVSNHLKAMGDAVVDMLASGDDAWAALKTKRYDFIILDWKLPGLSGLALFNRIRQRRGYRTTPLLVISGFLEQTDFRLLQEFPCTGLLEKPFTKGLFESKVESLVREASWYGENTALIDALVQAAGHDGKKTESLIKQVLKKSPNPVPLAVLASRRLITAGMAEPAEKILRGVLKLDDGCVVAMNEMGKSLHLLGRHEEALDVLRLANKISPQNVQRLCLLGEVELNVADPENARAYFEKALEIDGDAPKAKSGVVIADNMAEMLAAPDPMQVPSSFASILNTMGIALVRNGQFARGIEQYQAAMAFIRSKDDTARVAFNLGLGFLRWGKANEALPWFKKSEQLQPHGFGKSAGYVRRLVAAGKVSAGAGEEASLVGDGGQRFAPVGGKETKKPSVDIEDGDGEGAKVIQLPVAAKADIDEESVGGNTQVVLDKAGALDINIDESKVALPTDVDDVINL
jgi:CheY-like chemotaxis protein/Flp pilus assembly protein TadD